MKTLKDYEYFRTDLGVLYCGDCISLLRDIPIANVMISDLPYGVNYKYDIYNDTKENLQFIIKKIFTYPINRMALFTGITQMFEYPKPDWILCWAWNTTATYGKYGVNQWQPILCYGKDLKGFGSINGVIKGDLLFFSGGSDIGFLSDFKKNDGHPCPKPINVMQHFITRLSLQTDIILDPFFGSGTTGVACEKLNRKWIGIEISEKYCEIAKKRILQESQQLKMFTEEVK